MPVAQSALTPLEAATRVHNLAYLGYVAVLLVAAFFTWYAWSTGNKVQDIVRCDADARIATAGTLAENAKVDAARANHGAAEANETAALANERSKGLEGTNLQLRKQLLTLEAQTAEARKEVADLQTSAANAKAAQQRVEIELNKQKALAAIAERRLLELQERVKPRSFSSHQSAAFVDTLKRAPGTVNLGFTAGGGDEGFHFAQQILSLMKQAGWVVKNESSLANHMDISVTGVGILCQVPTKTDGAEATEDYMTLTPTLITLRAAFQSAGIDVQFIKWEGAGDEPEVVIGSKPGL